ncbi:MAG: regulatory iron-sulfur-containing complex subunit RicT, partial [Desulfovibrio sp.]
MPIYGLSYHKLAQTSYFQADEEFARGDRAVVGMDQGQTLGRVVSGPHADLENLEEDSLPHVVRRATEADLEQEKANEVLAGRARNFWQDCVNRRHLDMKLVDVEVFLDRSKFIFYFTAPARIDFRELVKDLVHEYRVRIELRQIGVRHETQMVGAVGNCGMVCCCRRYLRQFAPVTIRMAKEQNLFLNPTKV